MKVAKRSVTVQCPMIGAWLVAGAVVLCLPITSSGINSVTPAAGAVKQDTPAARCSPGVADIVKMVDAKVDPQVITTYIKASPTAYNPSATEIIALKDRGVGPEILTAMLQRGAEVQAQSMRAIAATPAPAPQTRPGAINPYAPAYDYGAQPVYPNYTSTYPVSSYVYPSYSYAYPAYSYGYSWPLYWPSFYFGFGSYPYRGYCGYPYGSYGYRYPYYCGGRGYYGGGYYGGSSFCGSGAYYGSRGYYGSGARPVPYAGQAGGFRSVGSAGRPAAFTSPTSGFRASGGFRGRPASFAGIGGGARSAGGSGGRSMGRSR